MGGGGITPPGENHPQDKHGAYVCLCVTCDPEGYGLVGQKVFAVSFVF